MREFCAKARDYTLELMLANLVPTVSTRSMAQTLAGAQTGHFRRLEGMRRWNGSKTAWMPGATPCGLCVGSLADGGGFEPPVPIKAHTLSRRAQ